MFDTIVVGVDGYEGGRDALALGALLQRTFGSRLVAVLAYPYDHVVSRASSPPYEAAMREDSQQALEQELERAGVDAEPVVAPDSSPPRALYRAAERHGAELIIVGSDRHGPVGRVLAGDVTAGTLHGAPCAVAVAPRGLADSQPALRAIAVGLDGSPESRAALELARDLARAADARLQLLCVVAPAIPVGPWTGGALELGDHDRAVREQAKALIANAIDELGGDVDADIAPGLAHEELAQLSHDVDLLVVGSRSYGPLRRLLLGSTSTKLVHEAACPVLVLPRGANEPDEAPASARPGAATA